MTTVSPMHFGVIFALLAFPVARGSSRSLLVASTDVAAYNVSKHGALNGDLRKWHKVSLGFQGPMTSETATPNPFTDFRLDVSFTHSETLKSYVVPGFYAADGNAANSHASSGNVWLVHFIPDEVGIWRWTATFVKGPQVAQKGAANSTSAGYFDGDTGMFRIDPTNKSGRDLRGQGRLQYVQEHHWRFAETGTWFLKAGADAPENFLAYYGFDNTPNYGDRRKTWLPHAGDYQPTDPTWAGGNGTEILGAINYLSRMGMNAISFLTMNIQGDDQNVFPYISDAPSDRQRFDVSKLAQWEVFFEHAGRMGMNMQIKTQETENDQLLDGGELGSERKVYYRELIARFSFSLALTWNLGEENTNTPSQRRQFADFFNSTDPYQHPVVIHTFPNEKELIFSDLLGYPSLDGVSLQSLPANVFNDTLVWRTRSAAAGHKWIVANDEQNPSNVGVLPDANDPTHDTIRKDVLWGNIMAGGAGVEYYFGYRYPNSDMTCQDFRGRSNMWDQSRYALEFISNNNVPFWNMSNQNNILSSSDWCLGSSDGEVYVVYLRNGGSSSIDLRGGSSSVYSVNWFDPRNGGSLQQGTVQQVNGTANQDLGLPPSSRSQDWVVLLKGNQSTNPCAGVPRCCTCSSLIFCKGVCAFLKKQCPPECRG